MAKREFRSRGPEGKPHSRAPEPRKGKPSGVKILKAKGGRIGLKSGTPPKLGKRGLGRIKGMHEMLGGSEKAKPHSTKEGRIASGKRRYGRFRQKALNEMHDIEWAGPDPEKGKPHSSREGQIATGRRNFRKVLERHFGKKRPAPKLPKPKRIPGEQKPKDPRSPYVKDRVMTPLRAKHGLGSLVKKVITKFKPKPKPKEVDVDKLLKNLGDEIKAAPLPPQLKKLVPKLKKAFPHHDSAGKLKKAKGGRISRGHGGSTMQQHYLQHGYGPTKARLRTGKPKIAKKGWA